MTIDPKWRRKAAIAADALRAALIAVEECGADPELTNIVTRLADDRTKLCLLFGLRPEQAYSVAWEAAHPDEVVSAEAAERRGEIASA